MVATAQATTSVNLLINAAGANHFAMLEQLSTDDINAMLMINLHAPILLTRAMLPLLRNTEQAMVVNVGSTYGSIGHAGYATYCASKFALRGFSEALRRELADTHVGVLYVAPRATRTTMNSPAAQALNEALKSGVDDPAYVAQAVVMPLPVTDETCTWAGRSAFLCASTAFCPCWSTAACVNTYP